MNAITKIMEAERSERSRLRDELSAARLKIISLQGIAKSNLWRMEGLCNRAEKAGVDVSYYRECIADDARDLS